MERLMTANSVSLLNVSSFSSLSSIMKCPPFLNRVRSLELHFQNKTKKDHDYLKLLSSPSFFPQLALLQTLKVKTDFVVSLSS